MANQMVLDWPLGMYHLMLVLELVVQYHYQIHLKQLMVHQLIGRLLHRIECYYKTRLRLQGRHNNETSFFFETVLFCFALFCFALLGLLLLLLLLFDFVLVGASALPK